jgi:alkylation response protein AidB-like acyl-CoA dehydrogenase
MDFELSADQESLRDVVRALCVGRFPVDFIRSLIDGEYVDRGRWRELADTGVFSLALPESDGGVGLGYQDAVIVFEELGRALVPGPLVGTFLAAGVVAGAATGDAIVGLVERPRADEGFGDGRPQPAYVEHLGVLDALLVLDDDGVWQIDDLDAVRAAARQPKPLDPLTPVWRVDVLAQGRQVGAAADAARWSVIGATLTSALQLGVATGACELATEYAKGRMQFGKPIGQFQAVKHMCADMVTRNEVCRAAVYWAGCALDDDEVGDPARAASVARIQADLAASENGKDCVQVHGGMGYTWEVDAHLYLKRGWVLATQFGSADEHAERMATYV